MNDHGYDHDGDDYGGDHYEYYSNQSTPQHSILVVNNLPISIYW